MEIEEGEKRKRKRKGKEAREVCKIQTLRKEEGKKKI
jgi:hypothetical protein